MILEKNLELKETEIEEKATSNRGELLASIHCLISIIKNYQETKIKKPIYIITDSEYVYYLINVRIWKYTLNDLNLKDVKLNKDLIKIIQELLFQLSEIVPNEIEDTKNEINNKFFKLIHPNSRAEKTQHFDPNWKGLTMFRQGSHLKNFQKEKLTSFQLEICQINESADDLCNLAMKNNDYLPVIEHCKE